MIRMAPDDFPSVLPRLWSAVCAVSLSSMFLTMLGPGPLHGASGDEPRTLDGWQLLLDESLVASQQDVRPVVHQPRRIGDGPLLMADQAPLESHHARASAVVRDPDSGWILLYYRAAAAIPGREGGGGFTEVTERSMVARSRDGIHWERPILGQVDVPGFGERNNCLPMKAELVSLDPHPPSPGRRFVMVYEEDLPTGGWSKFFAVSPDGLTWTRLGVPVGDLRKTARETPAPTSTARYLYVCQNWVKDLSILGRRFRGVIRMESDDLEHWTGVRWAFPRHASAYGRDLEDYGMAVPLVSENRLRGLWIGFDWLFHTDPQGPSISFNIRSGGSTDVMLAASRDSIEWRRVGWPQVFFPKGAPGSWDGGQVYLIGMLQLGDRLLFYYNGFDKGHESYKTFHAGIGVAELKRDRLFSLEGVRNGATITTVPVRCGGGGLMVNATAPAPIRVEVLEGEAPVPGYEAAACNPVTGDGLEHAVTWKGGRDLSGLRGRAISLRFLLGEGDDLYAFRITE